MRELIYQKNLLTSSLLNEALERQVRTFFREENRKVQLAFQLLGNESKKVQFEKINQCVNAVKRNITSGNYRLALCFLAVLKKHIDEFQ